MASYFRKNTKGSKLQLEKEGEKDGEGERKKEGEIQREKEPQNHNLDQFESSQTNW